MESADTKSLTCASNRSRIDTLADSGYEKNHKNRQTSGKPDIASSGQAAVSESHSLFFGKYVRMFSHTNFWKRLLSSTVSTISSIAIAASPLMSARVGIAQTLPVGGQVESGAATIANSSANSLSVNQTTDRAVVGWDSFSVGAGNQVTFEVPTSSGATLNRVNGSMNSTIAGQIQSNGQVYLVNPNGILITPTSTINTN
eukprot:gene57116-76274_t